MVAPVPPIRSLPSFWTLVLALPSVSTNIALQPQLLTVH